MLKIKFIAVLFIASVFSVACSTDSESAMQKESEFTLNSNSNSASMDTQTAEEPQSEGFGSGSGSGNRGGGDETENESVANPQSQLSSDNADKTEFQEPAKPVERKIIRNAQLELETGLPEEASRKITAIAKSKNGFVITSTQKSSNTKIAGRDSVSMTIRVPAEKFEESLAEIRKTVDRVIVETISGQDVTEEFVDIQARLKTKKALEERYLDIMKRANSVEDALKVEAQLGELRTEIEQIEGRKRFLENQASLSTITIELRTATEISASSNGFFYELKDAFADGLEMALTFILGLVRILLALLPFLVLIVLPVFLISRYFWRKMQKQKTAKKIVEDELGDENL